MLGEELDLYFIPVQNEFALVRQESSLLRFVYSLKCKVFHWGHFSSDDTPHIDLPSGQQTFTEINWEKQDSSNILSTWPTIFAAFSLFVTREVQPASSVCVADDVFSVSQILF